MIIYNKLKFYFSVLFHGRTSYQLKSKSISPFQPQRLKTLDSSFTNPSPVSLPYLNAPVLSSVWHSFKYKVILYNFLCFSPSPGLYWCCRNSLHPDCSPLQLLTQPPLKPLVNDKPEAVTSLPCSALPHSSSSNQWQSPGAWKDF